MSSVSNTGNGYMARIEELQRRADHTDEDRRRVWERLGADDKQMGVIENEIGHVREDVRELGEKLTAQSRWLAGACLTFTALAVAIVSVFG